MRTFCTHFPKYPENGHFWVFCENREKWGFFKPRKWRKPESGAQICGDPRRIIYCLDTRSGPQKRGFWGFCENPCFGGTANRVRTLCAGGVHTPSHSGSGVVHSVHRHRIWFRDVAHSGIRTYMPYIYRFDIARDRRKNSDLPSLYFSIASPKC
jgi:hypothetical protein